MVLHYNEGHRQQELVGHGIAHGHVGGKVAAQLIHATAATDSDDTNLSNDIRRRDDIRQLVAETLGS